MNYAAGNVRVLDKCLLAGGIRIRVEAPQHNRDKHNRMRPLNAAGRQENQVDEYNVVMVSYGPGQTKC